MKAPRVGPRVNRVWQLYRRHLGPYWRSCILLIGSYATVTLLTAARPLLLAPVLELAAGKTAGPLQSTSGRWSDLDLNNIGAQLLHLVGGYSDPWRAVVLFAIAFLLVAVLSALLTFCNYLGGMWIRVRAARDLRQNLFEHLTSLSLDFFHRQRTGELVSRIDRDADAAISGLDLTMSQVVTSCMLIVPYSILLARTNARLTVLVMIAGALHYGLTQAIRNPIRRRVRDQFDTLANTSAYLQEIFLTVRVIKSFAAEQYEASRFSEFLRQIIRVNMRYGVFKHIHEPVAAVINVLITVIILLFAANELLHGSLTPTGFFLYLYVGRAVVEPIGVLGQSYMSLQQTVASGERVMELFAEVPTVANSGTYAATFDTALRLDGVGFGYSHEPVLRSITLELKRGQVLAFVGASGVGKSTLVDLIMRFYDPQAGAITLDGRDLRSIELSSYRRLFGMVSQEHLLFNATIAENIAYCYAGATQADIEEAARVANAHVFIARLPDGYATKVGDRGIRLSGGQRQRIAIARAVVRRPQILILDEATSSLDSESERVVQEAIDRVISGTTAIVIAHRLSTVIHADQIVVLEHGRIVDTGKHAELLERCDVYRHLCQLQFRTDGHFAGSARPDTVAEALVHAL